MKKIKQRRNEDGSIVAYLLIALFLTGLLAAALTQGSKKSASTEQLDEMILFLRTDIKTVHAAIDECIQIYPGKVDVNGDGIDDYNNPNVPLPLYGDMTSGGVTGAAIAAIRCPGAPSSQQVVFSGEMGSKFKIFSDTANYTATYFTDGTEGSYMRVTRASADPLWTEAISRLNAKYSACQAAAVTAAGTCVNGCFYYWFLRRPTSSAGFEAGCP